MLSSRQAFLVLATSCLLLVRQRVLSLVPPHPNFVDWESVNEMRLRLNITYGYKTRHIADEYCRYLDEAECRRRDGEYGAKRAARRLNPSLSPPEGIKVLVLLIKFPETTYTLAPREYYDTLFNGEGTSDINPIGSIKEWMRFNSMGKYNVTFDVRDWSVAEQSEAYYSGGNFGHGQNMIPIFSPRLNELDSAGEVDWINGYVDEFGMLNHLVAIHSGIGAEAGDLSCLSTLAKNRIWSSGSESASPDLAWYSIDYWQLNGFEVATAFAPPACDESGKLVPLEPAPMAVYTHEYMHGLGLLDMYDQSGKGIVVGGLGRFDTMASLQGWDYNFSTPGHLSAYNRVYLRWLEPIVIMKDGYYALQPLEISASCYRINHSFPEGEYLYIENKQPIKWDSDVEQGGIVIYHVDEKAKGQTEPGYPGGPGWPAAHYSVALVQADGLFEIEKGIEFGNVGDFWISPKKLGSGGQQPNTDSYQGGVVKSTGVTIEILSSSSYIMMFKVTGIASRGAGIPESSDEQVPDNNSENSNNSVGDAMLFITTALAGLGLMLGVLLIVL